ncbi:MAG: PAS domain S-box protein, partial [Longimicrobiales bacterium]
MSLLFEPLGSPEPLQPTPASFIASDAIIAISADAIITTDEARHIIRFNRGAEEIFGYSAYQVIGKPIEILIPTRFREAHPAQVAGFAESPTVARRMGERRQISGIRKNGEEFPAEASISKTRADGGWYFTVALRDVTDRVRAEQAQRFLSESTERLNDSLNGDETLERLAAIGVPMLGDRCVVLMGDPAQQAWTIRAAHSSGEGHSAATPFLELPFDMTDAHPLMRCIAEGSVVIENRITPDVIRTWHATSEMQEAVTDLALRSLIAVPLIARGHTMGAMGFFRGVATPASSAADDPDLVVEFARRAAMALENARLYAEAQDAVVARDDVLAVVSHDLGNPLAAVRLSSTVLLRMMSKAAGNVEAEVQQVENIRTSVFQMERLIKDLLDIKRIEAGFLALDLERTPVSSILDEIFSAFGPLTSARSIELIHGTDGGGMQVLADRKRIQQVFSN